MLAGRLRVVADAAGADLREIAADGCIGMGIEEDEPSADEVQPAQAAA
jgi:hypothetical protein